MQTLKKRLVLMMAVFMMVSLCQPVIAESGKININTATKEQLMSIKGVGSKMADRIIEYREAQPFKSVEEITAVKGIGQKFLDKNKDLLTVE